MPVHFLSLLYNPFLHSPIVASVHIFLRREASLHQLIPPGVSSKQGYVFYPIPLILDVPCVNDC